MNDFRRTRGDPCAFRRLRKGNLDDAPATWTETTPRSLEQDRESCKSRLKTVQGSSRDECWCFPLDPLIRMMASSPGGRTD